MANYGDLFLPLLEVFVRSESFRETMLAVLKNEKVSCSDRMDILSGHSGILTLPLVTWLSATNPSQFCDDVPERLH